MDDLKLPIIKGTKFEPKQLSMDEYLRFVDIHLKYTFDRQAYEEWKKLTAVHVRFVIQ